MNIKTDYLEFLIFCFVEDDIEIVYQETYPGISANKIACRNLMSI